MANRSPDLDSREPRGIIIQTGHSRSAGVRFRAYLWSEELDPAACAAAHRGRILESSRSPDGLTPTWRASP